MWPPLQQVVAAPVMPPARPAEWRAPVPVRRQGVSACFPGGGSCRQYVALGVAPSPVFLQSCRVFPATLMADGDFACPSLPLSFSSR